jgi:hypothetical protein
MKEYLNSNKDYSNMVLPDGRHIEPNSGYSMEKRNDNQGASKG